MEIAKVSINVLVCDDDLEDRKLVRAYVQKIKDRSISLVEAGNMNEIVQALRSKDIDLVLMDIQMPERSGLDWLDEINQTQKVPVVMLTGHGSEELAVQAMTHGATGYLVKNGLSSEKLKCTIDNALEKWEQMQKEEIHKQELESLANIDPLTGLFNRRAIMHLLNEHVEHAGDSI